MLNNGSLYASSLSVFKTKLVRKGKQLYTLKKIYIITKDPSPKINNNSVLFFYFFIKLNEFHDITSIRQAEENDVLIDSIQSLINHIERLCFIEKTTEYKINIYTDKYRLIDSNSALVSFKGNVIFAKANQVNDLDSNKFIMSPKINHALSNSDLLQSGNNTNDNPGGNKLIKNTLLKFRWDLTKASFRNTLSQQKCTNRYYPIREKKAYFPHINIESFKYHRYNFSFSDMIESGKEPPNASTVKKPPAVELPSHYLPNKKFPSNTPLRGKCKYVFAANLYPIDQQSQTKASLTYSKSCKDIAINRQLQNIQKYLGFKRDYCDVIKYSNPKTIIHYPQLDSIKQEYTSLICAFKEYITIHLDNSLKQSCITLFNLSYSFLFHKIYLKFPFVQCQKEFIFYSYISDQFDMEHPGLLELFKTHNDMKPSEVISHINEYRSILHELINHPIKLIHYTIGKSEITLSSSFFQLFILCYDYFDKTQAALSDVIMMVLSMNKTSHISFEQYSNYYLYFKQYWLLSKDKQYMFLKKIVTFISKQHYNNSTKDMNNYFANDDHDNDDGNQGDQIEIDYNTGDKSLMSMTVKEVNNDIYDTFRSILHLSEPLYKLLLTPYDCMNIIKIKKKQAKLEELYERIVTYFNRVD